MLRPHGITCQGGIAHYYKSPAFIIYLQIIHPFSKHNMLTIFGLLPSDFQHADPEIVDICEKGTVIFIIFKVTYNPEFWMTTFSLEMG